MTAHLKSSLENMFSLSGGKYRGGPGCYAEMWVSIPPSCDASETLQSPALRLDWEPSSRSANSSFTIGDG